MMHDPSTRSERSEFAGQKWMQSSMPSHVDHQPCTTRLVPSSRRRPSEKGRLLLVCCLLVLASAGCVSKGDFLRLQEKVAEAHASQANEPDPFTRIAKLSTEVEALRQEVRDLQGELELARKESADALVEARRTRTALAAGTAATTSGAGSAKSGAEGGSEAAQGAAALGGSRAASESSPDQELAGYQAALDAWRKDDFTGCIDLFTTFLQKHPTSGYSDDAAYWLADCTYKNDEFKRAVVRFNAVVSVYPDSPKAPDALYRQGESLLKLGPKFHEAARTVFKKVQKDYPESERAAEAARQLERLGTG